MPRSSYGSVKQVKELSIQQMFSELGSTLIKQATEPNMSRYKPHDKQLEFHKSSAHAKLFLGGNRSGKSTGGVIEDLWWATRRHPYKQIPGDTQIRVRAIGDGFANGTVNKVLLPTFKRWILPSDLINGSWEDSYNRADHTLTLENESFIEFNSYDQDPQKHAGTSRHCIHFDEEPPQSIFAENLMRLIDTNGYWHMTLTPENGMDWVYEDYFEPYNAGKLEDTFIVTVSTLDNPFIDEQAIKNLMNNMSEEDRNQRIYGLFAEKSGLIFPEFCEAHLMDAPGWLPPPDWRIYMSLDHGLNNPTAALWHAVSPDNQVVTFREHYTRQEVIEQHAKAIHRMEFENNLEGKIFARPGDPAMKQRSAVTGTSVVQEYAEHGIYLSVDNIPRSVSIGLDRMRLYMKPTPAKDGRVGPPHWQIVRGECPNLIKELKKLRWASYASSKMNDRNNRKEEVHKKDDHAFDSSRYFFTMMPDLAPDQVWVPGVQKEFRLRNYIDTLVQMQDYAQTGWNEVASGFSESAYAESTDGSEYD